MTKKQVENDTNIIKIMITMNIGFNSIVLTYNFSVASGKNFSSFPSLWPPPIFLLDLWPPPDLYANPTKYLNISVPPSQIFSLLTSPHSECLGGLAWTTLPSIPPQPPPMTFKHFTFCMSHNQCSIAGDLFKLQKEISANENLAFSNIVTQRLRLKIIRKCKNAKSY